MNRARLDRLTPDVLDGPARALYDAITQGDRGMTTGDQRVPLVGADGALEGPFNAMLTSPGVGNALQELGAALRFRGSLPPFVREATILLVAAKYQCEFERQAHEPIALRLGMSHDELSELRAGQVPKGLSGEDTVAISCARVLVYEGNLDEGQYFELVEIVGQGGVFELVNLVGYYRTLACILAVFDVDS